MTTREKVFLAVAGAVMLPALLLLGYDYVYQPLKFRFLVSRVESARTAEEERAAFKLAANCGRVFKVHRIRPEDADTAHRRISGDWLLRLEWLESSPYGGRAYVAYRAVVETNNLRILWEKKY